jgi:carbon dioxide concentrating mechanism protein CcmN
MSVPLLRLDHSFNSGISGDVNIHPSAVLAPGVVLQAAVKGKIIIGPGVCIGMGSILQVSDGIIHVEAGANLGAGVLMVGPGKIGANACVGSATTIFNSSIAPSQVVPSGAVLGDTSRPLSNIPVAPEEINSSHPAQEVGQKLVADVVVSEQEALPIPPEENQEAPESASFGVQIYGQGSIERLLGTLFPHRQSLNNLNADNQSE